MDCDEIAAILRERIIGQREALDEIYRALLLAQAGINDPRAPLAVLLFLGPTGVGKTETVRALSLAIHGKVDAFCRVDMSGLAEHHYAASLAGAPPGYIGSHENETLLDKRLIEGGFQRPGILLLDEIEKAHPVVRQTLLQIFDNALLRLASGTQEIDFHNTIIIMTSNVGSAALKEVAGWREDDAPSPSAQQDSDTFPDSREHARQYVAQVALDREFAPEFLNRIDATVVFHWLDRQDLREIVDLQLRDINARLLERHGLTLNLDSDARAFLVERGFDVKYGARPLKRAIRRFLLQPLAELLLGSQTPGQGAIDVHVVDNRLALIPQQPISARKLPVYGQQTQIPYPTAQNALYPYPSYPGGRGARVRLPDGRMAS